MKFKLMVVLVLFILQARTQKRENELGVSSGITVNIEELYNEVLEVDSVLINGKLPIVCTLDSAILILGDTLHSYFDYSLLFKKSDTKMSMPIKVYVFKNAIFRQRDREIILLKLNFNSEDFLSYNGDTISRQTNYNFFHEKFPNSILLGLTGEIYKHGGSNAFTYGIKIRGSKNNIEFQNLNWRFFIQTEWLNSVEIINFEK